MIFLFATLSSIEACGEIIITNFPTGTVLCGTNLTLTWTYSSRGNYYFMHNSTEVDVLLYKHNEIEQDAFLGVLTNINYPNGSAMLSFPSPFPAAWLQASSDVTNDGETIPVSLFVQSSGGYENSGCTNFLGGCLGCAEPTFNMQCCPLGATCMTSGTCVAGQVCKLPGSPEPASAMSTPLATSTQPLPVLTSSSSTTVTTTNICSPGSVGCICASNNGVVGSTSSTSASSKSIQSSTSTAPHSNLATSSSVSTVLAGVLALSTAW